MIIAKVGRTLTVLAKQQLINKSFTQNMQDM